MLCFSVANRVDCRRGCFGVYQNRNRDMIYFQREDVKRWIIGAGIVIVTVILAVVLFNMVFVSEKISDTVDAGEKALIEMTNKSAIRMTVRGKIVANEEFKYYEITLKPQTREIKVLSGYNGEVVASRSYENNWEAYTEISYALKRIGMMKGRAFIGDEDDTRGVCPSGELTTFEVLDGGRTIKRLWLTSCKNDQKSFNGEHKKVSELILMQIPDHKSILKEAGL